MRAAFDLSVALIAWCATLYERIGPAFHVLVFLVLLALVYLAIVISTWACDTWRAWRLDRVDKALARKIEEQARRERQYLAGLEEAHRHPRPLPPREEVLPQNSGRLGGRARRRLKGLAR